MTAPLQHWKVLPRGKPSRIGDWLLRLAGFAGDEPHIPAVMKMMVVDDTQALRLQLIEWDALPTLTRIVAGLEAFCPPFGQQKAPPVSQLRGFSYVSFAIKLVATRAHLTEVRG